MINSHLPLGFSYGGIPCGIKPDDALDLALILSDRPCTVAAVFTQNRFAAAPVLYDRQLLTNNASGVRAVLINSGNANAVTGKAGLAAAQRSAESLQAAFGLSPWSTLVMSTGVIGAPLPVDRIENGLSELGQNLRPDMEGFMAAARAIMTTDTRPKAAKMRAKVGEQVINVAGMAKGSGMIHPNMATMLAVIATDADVPPDVLQLALKLSAEHTFNRISVDGDTSTNDTVALLANGAAGYPPIADVSSPAFEQFSNVLSMVAGSLARDIVRDGEGASKLVIIHVHGLEDDRQAHQVANAVAISPLVKTAIYGGDANWGRILMAAGNSGVGFDPSVVELWIEGGPNPEQFSKRLQLLAAGAPLDYDEATAADHFSRPELLIDLNLGSGPGQAAMTTCDLSHEYVTINGEYRT